MGELFELKPSSAPFEKQSFEPHTKGGGNGGGGDMTERLERLERKVDSIELTLSRLNETMLKIDARFDNVHIRLDGIEKSLADVDR